MGVKKKLGLGLASAALGLSLVGGGTFAYFNDTATVNNQFAAGTLNLDVLKDPESAVNFDLRNMKPGDNATRYFILSNNGSLSIKDVLMELQASNFIDGMGTTDTNGTQLKAFLDQFKVDFFKVQNPEATGPWANQSNLIFGNVSLKDLYEKNYSGIANPTANVKDGRLNLSPTGLPVLDKDAVAIKITFVNPNVSQNQYQGDSVKVAFNLEARQEDGVEVKSNGYIKSNENHPSTPVSTDNSDNKNITDQVSDAKDNPKE